MRLKSAPLGHAIGITTVRPSHRSNLHKFYHSFCIGLRELWEQKLATDDSLIMASVSDSSDEDEREDDRDSMDRRGGIP